VSDLDVQASLPLTEATYFIMLSLAAGPKHGYAILKDVEVASEGRVLLSTGTLYGGLRRFLQDRWIERLDDPAMKQTGRPRKVYTLTNLGQTILEAEIARLRALVSAANLRVAEERV
jgi:DNA-binding PadR family transcriptional regulator